MLRNRRPEDNQDIDSREISDDFAAREELLEDALTEHRRSRNGSDESPPATPPTLQIELPAQVVRQIESVADDVRLVNREDRILGLMRLGRHHQIPGSASERL